ncbi:MAG: glycosyltransferase family 2 protein [Candidatus Delongbacteria bacterium]|jgi:glycosyltransferase involved in cell wall biosynthesis|nr:glycosyltransferase family 2 protein [Candidatus Delongbacteria bacterium]
MKIAVLLPCYNESASIGALIDDIRNNLPESDIIVFDNNSTDNSVDIAKEKGVLLHTVKNQGKGHVVKAMFRDIDADYYVMMDADGTYPTDKLSEHINKCTEKKVDMLVGSRIQYFTESQSRKGHYWGNRLLTRTLNFLFNCDYNDILSGYRIMSNRFVKSIPLFSKGFEVETVLSVHAIEVDAKLLQVKIDYLPRIEGSESKLNTYRDGFKILRTILQLFRDYKPNLFYGLIALVIFTMGMIFGIPVVIEFFDTGLVERFPSAILASALVIISFIVTVAGIILSSVSRNRTIIKKLAFLSSKK